MTKDKKGNSSKKKKGRIKANGEGTIYITKNGYRGQFTVGRRADGSYIRKSFSGKTKLEINKQRDEYMASVQNGTYVETSKMNFGEWLLYWLVTFRKNSVSDSTYDHYEDYIIKHIIPALGHVKLQKITTTLLMQMYNEMYENGRLDGKGGLSGSTIKQIHITINMALRKAFLMDKISKNVASACELRFTDDVDKKMFYTIEEQERILGAIDLNKSGHLFVLTCMLTGLRKGECIPLTWDDIDFENLLIHVNKTITTYKNRDADSPKKLVTSVKGPKTRHSIRSVPITPKLTSLLKKHRQKVMKDNLASGRPQKNFNLVFPTRNGTPHNESNVNKTWGRILKNANVEHVIFHGTRHSYVTRLFENNLTSKAIQANVGHSKAAITENVYAHVTSAMLNTSRDIVSKAFDINDELLANEGTSSDDDSIRENTLAYIAI